MASKKFFDGTFRIYSVDTNELVSKFILRGYPTASSLEKIRYNMSFEDCNGVSQFYVTLELRMYEIETNL